MGLDFDKNTVTVLRYVYKHPGVTEGQIIEKFGDDGTSMLLINFSMDMYLLPQDENNRFFVYDKEKMPFVSTCKTRWFTTPKANALLQDLNFSLWKWLVPLLFSALSLAISFAMLILKIFGV